jgi:hypothetical protein
VERVVLLRGEEGEGISFALEAARNPTPPVNIFASDRSAAFRDPLGDEVALELLLLDSIDVQKFLLAAGVIPGLLLLLLLELMLIHPHNKTFQITDKINTQNDKTYIYNSITKNNERHQDSLLNVLILNYVAVIYM